MLADLLLEERGQITGQRVLEAELQKIEISYTASGKYKGNTDYSEVATYWSIPAVRKNKESYGERHGIITTNDGESATWKLHGVGQILPSGNRSLKGSAIYRTIGRAIDGSEGRLADLDNVLVVFEYEIDQRGSYHGKAWQWK